jgi:alkanesulfonate monooxygenase SsuD/methylene tetrahydromethanopterin reductase-like flavin-dependent oxidoreductase (luciferase family)
MVATLDMIESRHFIEQRGPYDCPMKLGVQLPEVERPPSWRETRDIARTIEDSGFDSLWVGDHLLYRDDRGARGPFEAWTSLAALAEVTSRVAIGPLVAATSFHAPAMLAKMAATVDEISGGRLILGLGAGWNQVEYEAFGFRYDHRVSRFEEAFTIIRTLLVDGAIDWDGDFYTLRDMELLPRARGDMKILVGSNGPRMLRATMPHADMWNSWFDGFGNRAEGLGELRRVVDEACVEVGRDPSEVERTVAVYVQLRGGGGRQPGDAERGTAPPISGSRSEIAEHLRSFEEAGISHLQIVLDPIDAKSVEELAAVVSLI